MDETKNQNQRRKYLVDWSAQGPLLTRVLAHWIITGSVATIYLIALQMLSTTESMSFGEHISLLWTKYWALGVVFITLFPVFAYDSLKLSHRIAGPILSFRAALAKLAQGDKITQLNFRRRDYWQDLANSLNELAQRIGQVDSNPSNDS